MVKKILGAACALFVLVTVVMASAGCGSRKRARSAEAEVKAPADSVDARPVPDSTAVKAVFAPTVKIIPYTGSEKWKDELYQPRSSDNDDRIWMVSQASRSNTLTGEYYIA